MRVLTQPRVRDVFGMEYRILELFPPDEPGHVAMALAESADGSLRLVTLESLKTDGFQRLVMDADGELVYP